MRSYTFSSSQDLPPRGWTATWAVAIILIAATLMVVEIAGRKHGFKPSVKDGPELWSAYRQRARTPPGQRAPLVLIGSSRFMLGIDPSVLADVISRPVLNLAIDGSLPFPILEDLASDEAFHGWVLCEMGGSIGNEELVEPAGDGKPMAYLKYFHSRTWISDAEALLRQRVQDNLVFLLPDLSPREIVDNLLSGHLETKPSYIRMVPGRFRPADYSGVDLEAHRRHWMEAFGVPAPRATGEQIIQFAATLSEQVRRIQNRGGNVIFMRMVSSGGVRAVEDRKSPRDDWNLFASQVVGIAFHYDDIPALRAFEAADGSHLDMSSVCGFSRALGDELVHRNSFRDRPF